MRAGPTMSRADASATAGVPGQDGARSALRTSPTDRVTFSPTRTFRQGPAQAASSSEVRWTSAIGVRTGAVLGARGGPAAPVAEGEAEDAGAQRRLQGEQTRLTLC